jgi:hypothetical protein
MNNEFFFHSFSSFNDIKFCLFVNPQGLVDLVIGNVPRGVGVPMVF